MSNTPSVPLTFRLPSAELLDCAEEEALETGSLETVSDEDSLENDALEGWLEERALDVCALDDAGAEEEDTDVSDPPPPHPDNAAKNGNMITMAAKYRLTLDIVDPSKRKCVVFSKLLAAVRQPTFRCIIHDYSFFRHKRNKIWLYVLNHPRNHPCVLPNKADTISPFLDRALSLNVSELLQTVHKV